MVVTDPLKKLAEVYLGSKTNKPFSISVTKIFPEGSHGYAPQAPLKPLPS